MKRDPLAVALANISLLGVGYVWLGRRGTAVVTTLVTFTLVCVLVWGAPTVWFEALVFVWWAALVAHGWYLAGGWVPRWRRGPGGSSSDALRQRLIAAGLALLVLGSLIFLRVDAAHIDRNVARARASGSCGDALSALDDLRFVHRIADAPRTDPLDDTRRACELLRLAAADFRVALNGQTGTLDAALRQLVDIRADLPGHEPMIETAWDRFLRELPTDDPCRTREITEWLGGKHAGIPARAADTVARVEPAALVDCGDDLMAAIHWTQARASYQQLLDRYPSHALAPRARGGVTRATQLLELTAVRRLLSPGSSGAQPAYCSQPARYSGADPYRGGGPNRAMVFGGGTDLAPLPAEWLTKEAAEAALVICAGNAEHGTVVATCPYHPESNPGRTTFVSFHRKAIPVRVFELRTGQLVVDTKVEIGGSSCPQTLTYTSSRLLVDLGPPSDVYVTSSDADVRAAFQSLINP